MSNFLLVARVIGTLIFAALFIAVILVAPLWAAISIIDLILN